MADINVYGAIGDDFWDDNCVSAADFSKALTDANGEDVTIHINSCGGNVFDANTMAELLRAYKGKSTASIEGVAASAASYFALTADEVVMNPSALMMVHNPSTVCAGQASDMRECADFLDKVCGTIVSQYVKKTGTGADEIRALMDAETWMDATEALERGFVDSLTDDEPVTACVSAEVLKRFKNTPDNLGKAAGDTDPTITSDNHGNQAAAGAVAAGAGAAPRKTVCVKGQFLTY